MISRRTAFAASLALVACHGAGTLPETSAGVVAGAYTRPAHATPSLYVSDPVANAVVVYDATRPGSTPVRRITAGIDGPAGLTVDASGNLYVANTRHNTVAVYPRGSSEPVHLYSALLVGPDAVAVDTDGDIFVGNFDSFAAPIVEYPAGSESEARNAVASQCPCFPTAIALDSRGDLFAAYNSWYAQTVIYRYSNGSRDGRALRLDFGQQLWEAAGMEQLGSGNLVVARSTPPAVEVFGPHGGQPRYVYHGFGMPRAVAADAAAREIFVSDEARNEVVRLEFPSGKRSGIFSDDLRSAYGIALDARI